MNYGERIKQLRKKAKLSQTELAQRADLSLMSIRRYEKGERVPNIEQLKSIGKVFQECLGVSITAFISDMHSEINEDFIGSYVRKVQAGEIPTEEECLNIVKNLENMSSIRTEVETQEKIRAINEIIASFKKLNRSGISESVKRVKELTYLPRYKVLFSEDDDNKDMNGS